MIETSGLALPKPLVQAFHWPAIKSRVTVDGVVAVVDGAALADGRVAADLDALARQRSADSALDHDNPIEEVFEDQIACADLIVLNKRDLLDADGVGRAPSPITRRAAPRGQDRRRERTARSIRPLCSASASAPKTISRTAAPITTTNSITTTTISTASSSRFPRLQILPRWPPASPGLAENYDVLRVKGFAAVAGKPMRLLVQAVGARVTHHYDRPGGVGTRAKARLVVIGLKGLDRAAVTRCSDRVSDASAPTSIHQLRRDRRAGRSRARPRATSWCCRLPTATSPALRRHGRRSGMRCRACGSRICAICAIRCRSISGSTVSPSTPK